MVVNSKEKIEMYASTRSNIPETAFKVYSDSRYNFHSTQKREAAKAVKTSFFYE
jgi:hypothetical protein